MVFHCILAREQYIISDDTQARKEHQDAEDASILKSLGYSSLKTLPCSVNIMKKIQIYI